MTSRALTLLFACASVALGQDDAQPAPLVEPELLAHVESLPEQEGYTAIPIAQLALSYGADDVDGTVVEEKIYHEAGATTPQEVAREELMQWIRDAGRIPVERDTLYNVVWSPDESLARTGDAVPVNA